MDKHRTAAARAVARAKLILMSAKEQAQPEREQGRKPTRENAPVGDGPQTSTGVPAQRARRDPRALTPRDARHLQRTIGNRALTSLVQRKLTVGPANDPYEQEADRVPAQVMATPTAPVAATAPINRQTHKENVGARAFTAGQDVFFGDGAYVTGTTHDQELLAHEMTHAVWQTGPAASSHDAAVVRPPMAGPATQQMDPSAVQVHAATRASNIQRRVAFEKRAEKYHPDNPEVKSALYKNQVANLEDRTNNANPQTWPKGYKVSVDEGGAQGERGRFQNVRGEKNAEGEGVIHVQPLAPSDKDYAKKFNSNIGTLAHEMQHATDYVSGLVKWQTGTDTELRAEWRAWAVQAGVTYEHQHTSPPGDAHQLDPYDVALVACFEDERTLRLPTSRFMMLTEKYLNNRPEPERITAQVALRQHGDWLAEAQGIFADRKEHADRIVKSLELDRSPLLGLE